MTQPDTHPDTGWALLTTELQSHLLGARQILLEFDNFNCELVCKINLISPVDDNKQHSCSLSVKINSLLVITRGQISFIELFFFKKNNS